MNTKTIKRGGVLAIALASVLAVTGCTGSSDSGGKDADNIYVQAINGDPMTVGLNAQFVGGTLPILFSAQIMDPLIFLSDDYKLTPALAKSWKLSDDGLTLTLNLRTGVKWHDGKPFTAEDVKFNLDEILPLQNYGAALAERIDSVEITGKSAVVVHLKQPYGPLLETISSQFILPKHIYQGTNYVTNDANKKPIGTGPMMFDSYTAGEKVVLAKNPHYWGGKVKVDRAVYTVNGDPNARAEALFSGEIDQATLDPSQQDRVSANKDTELFKAGAFPEAVTMTFNTRTNYLADPAVRIAIFSALDRHAMVKKALSGIGTPAVGFFPPSMKWAVNTDVNFDKDFPRDLDAINAALDKAGFPRGADGTRFTLKVQEIQTLSETVAAVEMAQATLEKIGIKTKVTSVGGAVYSDNVYTKNDFDLAFVRTTVGPDPSLGIMRMYECNPDNTVSRNPTGLCDPEIDAAADAALATNDKTQRGDAFKALQARAEKLMYYAPLAWYNGAFPTISSSRWHGQDAHEVMAQRMPWLSMTLAK